MTLQRIYSDPQAGEVVFRKRAGVRRVSIRVSPGRGVSVTLPYLVSYDEAMRFYISKREWVLKTIQRQKEAALVTELSTQELAQLRKLAAGYLPERLSELASRYGFSYSSLRLKHNRTNWGSCSSRGNINLNISLMKLPSLLRDYVILHELCHLRHHDHSRAFHLLLEHLLTDHLMRVMEGGTDDVQAKEMAALIARKAALSRAVYPIDRVFSSTIRTYRP
ncbi:MAG: M48 family metallopeptidase [Candidatus Cryptobacteroides sp.]